MIIKINETSENNVIKFFNSDGSETIVKSVSSCGEKDEKITIFVSSSVGCFVGCKFCGLSDIHVAYRQLKIHEIISNFDGALKQIRSSYNDFLQKYVKISFMGMGDCLEHHEYLHDMIRIMCQMIIRYGFRGIDTIDIGSSLPFVYSFTDEKKELFISNLFDLEKYIYKTFPTNPKRTPYFVRFFYSNHSLFKRYKLISRQPAFNTDEETFEFLHKINESHFVGIHQVLFQGINDNEDEIEKLFRLSKDMFQIRLLRFNEMPNVNLKESKQYIELFQKYEERFHDVKIQISRGKEINASCGQFF